MNSYWPSGIDLSDTSSPKQILQGASQEWIEGSAGLLSLVIQEAKSTTGNQLLIVHAKHSPTNRTATLFTIIHRPNAHYPCTIEPRDTELPEYLRKSFYQPGFAGISSIARITDGRRVENEWVCDTPSELREKLKRVFNLGTVKSDIISLVSSDGVNTVRIEDKASDSKKSDEK